MTVEACAKLKRCSRPCVIIWVSRAGFHEGTMSQSGKLDGIRGIKTVSFAF